MDTINYISKAETEILEKIDKMRGAEATIKEISNLETPVMPKPQKVYSLSEYAEYNMNLINFNKVVHLKSKEVVQLELLRKQLCEEIMSVLPASNTWFKIGNFHIGYETDDWPMSKPSLLIEENIDEANLSNLKHRHIE